MERELIIFLFLILAAFLLFGLVLSVFMKLEDFLEKLHYIKLEIRRTKGREKKYWIRRKRRLWLSWLPFFHE